MKQQTVRSTLPVKLLNSIDGALNDEESATVQYSLNKRPKDMWNFVVGSQYQINKHFMIRAEAGFLGSRHTVHRRTAISFWPLKYLIS